MSVDERPLHRGAAAVQWGIGLVMAVSLVAISLWARLPLPYRDDWDWLRWLLGPTALSSYFVPHNEHLIPLARLLLQLQYALEGSNGYTMLGVSLASLGLVAVLVLAEIGRRWPADAVARRWVSGVALTLLCGAWQLQSLIFPAAVLFPLVEMFAVASLACVLNAAASARTGRRWWLLLTLVFAVGAMLTTTNGLPVPVMLALVAAARRMPWTVVAGLLLVAALGVATYAGLVLLHQADPIGTRAPMAPWQVLAYFLAFHASFVAHVSEVGGVIVGTLLVAAALCAVCTTLWRDDRPRLEYFAAGLLLFTMASAALAAPTRASLGIAQAAQSRYASFVLPFWTALCLVGASRLATHRLRTLAAPVLAASILALGLQIAVGAVWVAKADNVATAGLALASGSGDEEWLLTLHPSAAVVREVSAALIAQGDRTLGGASPQPARDAVAHAAACDATAQISTVPVGSGLRLHAAGDDDAERGVILDRSGRTVGLARRADVVGTPNPSPMEVARAVAQAVRAPAGAPPRWIGFAADGEGAPYALVLLTADGRPICRATATGPGPRASGSVPR